MGRMEDGKEEGRDGGGNGVDDTESPMGGGAHEWVRASRAWVSLRKLLGLRAPDSGIFLSPAGQEISLTIERSGIGTLEATGLQTGRCQKGGRERAEVGWWRWMKVGMGSGRRRDAGAWRPPIVRRCSRSLMVF